METKTDMIKAVIRMFQSTAGKYCQGEALPIQVNTEVTVSTREAHVIQAINDNKNIGVTELGGLFGTSKSAASQLVSRLSKKGFLKKKPSPSSNKEIRLVLTPLGRQAYDAHQRHHKKDLEHILSRLETFSLSQIATLAVLFEALDEIMDQRLNNEIDDTF